MMKVVAVFLSFLFMAIGLDAGELEVVASIRYEDLRGKIRLLSPDYGYGDRSLRLWADIDDGCFESEEDVLGALDGWFGLPDQGFPTELEVECRPWLSGQSIVVFTESSHREQPPRQLAIFSGSPTGKHLTRNFFHDSVGDSRIVDQFAGFSISGGHATAFLHFEVFPERVGSWEWASTRLYLLDENPRMLHSSVLAVYRTVAEGSTSFVVLQMVRPFQRALWKLTRVGRGLEEIASAADPTRLSESSTNERPEPGLWSTEDLMLWMIDFKKDEEVETLFESWPLTEKLEALETSAGCVDS